MCIRQHALSYFAMTAAIFSSYFSPHISFMRSAPACIPASATADLYVSSDTATSKSLFIASMIGAVLSISSSSDIFVYPGLVDSPPTSIITSFPSAYRVYSRGLVDSPPTSIITAPSAIIFSVVNRAVSMVLCCPPSENESGVTFSIPIT